MVKTKVVIFLLCILSLSGHAQTYEWSSAEMNGSRTGCTSISHDNLSVTLGHFFENGDFMTPDGRIHAAGSSVAEVARVVMDAQPAMERVKTVIAFSEEEMVAEKLKETPLSNWFVGIIMGKVSSLSGKKIDIGICNFGGIRANMPEGDVILDDILSMFPFKNNIIYLEHKGSELRKIFEKMAATHFQAVAGVEIVAENGRLTKVLVGGEPLDDERIYSVATISFLLHGGDSLTLADNALSIVDYDVQIVTAVVEYIESLKAEGKNITAPEVTYVTVK